MSFLWGPFEQIIDDYEDQDLDEYNQAGKYDFNITTGTVKRGSAAITADITTTDSTVGENAIIDSERGSGLPNYPVSTETMEWWFRIESPNGDTDIANIGHYFAIDATNFTPLDEGVGIRYDRDINGNDYLAVFIDGSGNFSQASSNWFNFSTWYKMKTQWRDDDIFPVIALDKNGNLQQSFAYDASGDTLTKHEDWAAFFDVGSSNSRFIGYLDHARVIPNLVTAKWNRDPSSKNVYLSETVDFTDTSTSEHGTVDQWDWDFDDGNTSTNQNPSHTWSSKGDYTVELQAQDDLEFKDTTTEVITVVELLDDFEDGDINEYQGITSAYSVTSGASNQRSKGLESDPNQNSGEIFDTDVTVQQGDNISADLQVNKENGVAYFLFGVQDNSNYYTVFIDHKNQETKLQRIESNTSDPVIDSASLSFNTGQWFTAQIQWGGSGGFTVDLLLNNASSKATLTGSDTGFTSGGIGWRADNDQCYFDFARILADESLK